MKKFIATMEIDEYADEKCTGLYESNPNERAMCIRTAMAHGKI